MKNFFCITIIFFLFFSTKLSAIEIKTLATINDKIITNIDLDQQIKLVEIIYKKKIENYQRKEILDQIITLQIKKYETEKTNINYNETLIEQEVKKIFNNIKVSKEYADIINIKKLKQILYENIKTEYMWNRLIVSLYAKNLTVNTKEIDEISKNKKLNKEQIEDLTNLEKNKKIQILSKTHFNIIKKKYFVEKE